MPGAGRRARFEKTVEEMERRTMNIEKATAKYEAWLAKRIPLLKGDLDLKYKSMREAVFPFLRATFYRWSQLWPKVCPAAAKAPVVLAIGDLHVENFGTWRDTEGRLIWGLNDFDEVNFMPYTIDLVRLSTSAHLAIDAAHLTMGKKDACDSILKGYKDGLAVGGRAIVLGEHHHWLRELAISEARDPFKFWEKMQALPTWRQPVPKGALKALNHLMPEAGLEYRIAHRRAGLGSLGRERYVAITDWRGGKIAREAKALATSAYVWALGSKSNENILYQDVLDRAVRCPDPFVQLRGRWIIRRLAPDCSRVELSSLPEARDELRLLYEMGWETANVHLGSKRAIKAVLSDLRKRPMGWLHEASQAMAKATMEDWKEWKAAKKSSG
jgi:Uncharacterized protein conserved in bacteria (DUF2252)